MQFIMGHDAKRYLGNFCAKKIHCMLVSYYLSMPWLLFNELLAWILLPACRLISVPFCCGQGEGKASKYFISPNQAVAVAQPNVPSQYFETI